MIANIMHIHKILKRFFTPCVHCGNYGAERVRLNTAYVDDRLNWMELCDACDKEQHEYYQEMWEDYYGSRL